MDGPLVRVLAGAGLAPGTIARVRVDGTDILVARLADGHVVAFAATCPHQRTDLEGADLVDGLVRCPLHAYMYDARTGENVEPTRHADPAELWKLKPGYLPVHRVDEREGWIWVDPDPRPAPPSHDPGRERPPGARPPASEPLGANGALDVAVGTTFELRLPVAGQGHVWRVQTGTPQLVVVGERLEAGSHRVRIAARGGGRFTVTCRYARPWDREPAAVRRYDVTVYS